MRFLISALLYVVFLFVCFSFLGGVICLNMYVHFKYIFLVNTKLFRLLFPILLC